MIIAAGAKKTNGASRFIEALFIVIAKNKKEVC
jgi:hypothetical protein